MPDKDDRRLEHRNVMASGKGRRRLHALRPRRTSSILGWVLWLLIALLFFFLISKAIAPWLYTPVPTKPLTAPPSSNTGQT